VKKKVFKACFNELLFMKVKGVRSSKNELVLEVIDEGHTLLNLIKAFLVGQPGVVFAGYKEEHPLLNKTFFTLKTKYKTPKEVMNNAFKRINEELKTASI